MGIKLKKGDYVDVRGLNKDQVEEIIDAFLESGAKYDWGDDPHDEGVYDFLENVDVVFINSRGDIDGYDHLGNGGAGCVNKVSAEVILASQNSAISVNRNVVFTDYETNHLPGSMEIIITDGEEVTVCVDELIAFDNVASKKNIEETVDILKVWRSIIDSAIKEMEETQ